VLPHPDAVGCLGWYEIRGPPFRTIATFTTVRAPKIYMATFFVVGDTPPGIERCMSKASPFRQLHHERAKKGSIGIRTRGLSQFMAFSTRGRSARSDNHTTRPLSLESVLTLDTEIEHFLESASNIRRNLRQCREVCTQASSAAGGGLWGAT
jgi:hypothetical protein